MKNLQKKITEFHQKICAEFFSVLHEKFVCFEFPCIIQKTGFFSVFADVRIKPRY
jgi:hypothetical protein